MDTDKKQKIRELYVAKRRAIPMFEKRESDRRIAEVLVRKKQWRQASNHCIYVSLPAEVDTRILIDESFRQGKKVIVPKVRRDEGIVLHEIKSVYDLQPGPYHVLEPHDTCPLVPKSAIELFIIPGLAFDHELYRIGWGSGLYDRLLTHVTAPKIALAYECQISNESLPHSPEDVQMDMVITESETHVR